jgi:hypothetical protein
LQLQTGYIGNSMSHAQSPEHSLSQARYEVLQQLEDWLDVPMLVLSFVWLALFVVELIWRLNPLLEAKSIQALHAEVAALRTEIQALSSNLTTKSALEPSESAEG